MYFQTFVHITLIQQINFDTKNRVYLYSSKNPIVLLKIPWIFVIAFSLFVLRNFRSTCSSLEMLKGSWSEQGWEPLVYFLYLR